MHQKKNKKILFYFFLLIILSSTNNFENNKLKFINVNTINVSGLNYIDNEVIKNDLKSLNLKNIFFLEEKKIAKILDSYNLVEDFIVTKRYPSTLDISLTKTKFLAQLNKDGETFIIGSNGKLIKKKSNNYNLPYIFGKPEIEEFLFFKKMIDQSKIKYNEIKSLYFFPSRRWDLELNNSILIKLSKEKTQISLNDAYEFINSKNFKNIKIIDARINNQIILND